MPKSIQVFRILLCVNAGLLYCYEQIFVWEDTGPTKPLLDLHEHSYSNIVVVEGLLINMLSEVGFLTRLMKMKGSTPTK